MASSIAPPSMSTRDRNKEEDEIMALFESYERRIDKISGVLAQYGIGSVEECREICRAKGFDPYEIVKSIQPICFENACWAYTVGAAIALKAGVKTAAEAAKLIGVGLQSFCIDGSVAEDRKVGLGHGNLGAMLLSEESKCFAFLAGHESFAAAEGAIGIVNGLGRLAWSTLSDWMGRAATYVFFFVIETAAFFALAQTPSEAVFYILVLTIISCYGGGFSCMPAFLSDLFGVRQLSSIHGIMLTAWALAGIAGPMLLSVIKETTGSYHQTMLVFAGLMAAALLLSVILKVKSSKH